MSKRRLNTDEVFENIMGIDGCDQNLEEVIKATPRTTKKTIQSKEKLIQTSFYISEKHRKALKIRAALAENINDKDQSSIVRAALDAYLADTLKNL